MLDRGLRRRFDPAVERAARKAAEEPPHGEAGARRDLRDLPTFTIDPPTARDFDDAISAERLDDGAIARLGPHRRRLGARDAGLARRPRGLPPRHERLRPRQGRADAAGGALQPGLLARARRGPARGHGRARARRARRCGAPPSPLARSAPTRASTTRRSTASSPARERAEEPWAEPLARGAGGGRRARGGAPGARRARDRVGRARVRLLARGPRHRPRARASRPSPTA